MKTIIFTLLLASSLFICNANADNAPWTYAGKTGPTNWGTLDPSYQTCAAGKEQSPINIENATLQRNNSLKIQYHSAPLQIINDGTTTLKIDGHKTIVNTGHSIQLNFPEQGPKEILTLGGSEYHLIQFHFHTPAENLINGKTYPAEIHFVHQNQQGELAVIGVWVKAGQANAKLETILNNLPAEEKVLKTLKNIYIKPNDFTPTNTTYYSFDGSLTTPPCSEHVQWIMIKNPIEASSAQIEKLHKANGEDNARPIQPLNNRKIYEFETAQ